MSASPAKKTVHPLLQKYLAELALHPLRTKALTAAVLCFLQEIVGSHLAGVPVRKPAQNAPFIGHLLARGHIKVKAAKMALYGFLVSAPLSHYLIGLLQRAFAGKAGKGCKAGTNSRHQPSCYTYPDFCVPRFHGHHQREGRIENSPGGILARPSSSMVRFSIVHADCPEFHTDRTLGTLFQCSSIHVWDIL